MAQVGYTPIRLYYSTTASAAPTAGNLADGELAINTNDGKLFYKDSGGTVQTIAYKNVPISTLSGAGTGVLTALGVNVGTAGAFVVNGGALGTPSSGTVTNLTGTASININGTVGATTANTGAFTSITSTSASGILTRPAATQDGVAIVGRAGGINSYEVTITPTTLSADRTLTLPDATTTVAGTDATQTLTNKRINPRVLTSGSTSGNFTIDGDTTDLYVAEGLSGAITFLQPSGTPVNGQKLMIRIEDNGTSRGITWTTTSGAFRAVGVTLPTTTTAGKVTYIGCVYNSTDVFWDVIATVTQA